MLDADYREQVKRYVDYGINYEIKLPIKQPKLIVAFSIAARNSLTMLYEHHVFVLYGHSLRELIGGAYLDMMGRFKKDEYHQHDMKWAIVNEN